MAKFILSVGQCWADHTAIARTVEKHFGGAVEPVDSAAEALARLRDGGYDLVLVNRILDADGSSGVDLIRRLKEEPSLREVPVMLVSNYEDAQQEAVAAGAVPGFGKGALGHPQMLDRVRKLLQPESARG